MRTPGRRWNLGWLGRLVLGGVGILAMLGAPPTLIERYGNDADAVVARDVMVRVGATVLLGAALSFALVVGRPWAATRAPSAGKAPWLRSSWATRLALDLSGRFGVRQVMEPVVSVTVQRFSEVQS